MRAPRAGTLSVALDRHSVELSRTGRRRRGDATTAELDFSATIRSAGAAQRVTATASRARPIAHDSRWSPLQRARERLPVGLGCVGKGLHAPQPHAALLEPAAQKTRNAIRKRPVAGSRTEKGRSSTSNEPAVGQADGR